MTVVIRLVVLLFVFGLMSNDGQAGLMALIVGTPVGTVVGDVVGFRTARCLK